MATRFSTVASWIHGTRLLSKQVAGREVGHMDPDPSYDMSDEIEYFLRYSLFGLRGVVDGNGYPPPAYPPV
jgi:hypothetical protein